MKKVMMMIRMIVMIMITMMMLMIMLIVMLIANDALVGVYGGSTWPTVYEMVRKLIMLQASYHPIGHSALMTLFMIIEIVRIIFCCCCCLSYFK